MDNKYQYYYAKSAVYYALARTFLRFGDDIHESEPELYHRYICVAEKLSISDWVKLYQRIYTDQNKTPFDTVGITEIRLTTAIATGFLETWCFEYMSKEVK